jgi:hypothetical protein
MGNRGKGGKKIDSRCYYPFMMVRAQAAAPYFDGVCAGRITAQAGVPGDINRAN